MDDGVGEVSVLGGFITVTVGRIIVSGVDVRVGTSGRVGVTCAKDWQPESARMREIDTLRTTSKTPRI
jgi:hypothetical protein